MTAQISDRLVYQSEEYILAASKGTGLFNPRDYGIRPRSFISANWRGFHCTYSVLDDALFMTRINIGLSPEDIEAMRRGDLPDLFGVRPESYFIEGEGINLKTGEQGPFRLEMPDSIMKGLRMPIAYTGGMLIGSDFIPEMAGMGGCSKRLIDPRSPPTSASRFSRAAIFPTQRGSNSLLICMRSTLSSPIDRSRTASRRSSDHKQPLYSRLRVLSSPHAS